MVTIANTHSRNACTAGQPALPTHNCATTAALTQFLLVSMPTHQAAGHGLMHSCCAVTANQMPTVPDQITPHMHGRVKATSSAGLVTHRATRQTCTWYCSHAWQERGREQRFSGVGGRYVSASNRRVTSESRKLILAGKLLELIMHIMHG